MDDKVYIVYEIDQNDETTIHRVFSDVSNADSFRKELLESYPFAHICVDVW